MITQLLKDLKETWGYTTEELNDIREKMEELSSSSYWEGRNDEFSTQNDDIFTGYGKKEDFQ